MSQSKQPQSNTAPREERRASDAAMPRAASTKSIELAMSRVVWSVLGGSASGGFAALAARAMDVQSPLAIVAGVLVGGLIACAVAMQAIMRPAQHAHKERDWLIQTLGQLARANREQEFKVLIEQYDQREIQDLASACYAALLSAHHDRLEAAALRREMDSRVEKRTRVAVAELSKISSTDELTGVQNRRGFEHALTEIWNETASRSQELAIVAIDLDHFKQLNDQYGHGKGDDALRAVGETLRASLRDGDVAGRIGGDELVICLRGAGSSTARAVAERCMSQFARHPAAAGLPWPTMSIGIACAAEHTARTPQQLRRMADDALYRAKRSGRATCVIYDPTWTTEDRQGAAA